MKRRWPTTQKRVKKNKFNSFEKRLKSFSKFSFIGKFSKMSACGFRYVNGANYIVCYICHLRDYNFLRNYDPVIYHAKNSPKCIILHKIFGSEWIYNTLVNPIQQYDYNLFVCKICHVRRIFCYYFPCLHAVSCEHCFQTSVYCAYCDLKIHSYKKIYY